MRINNKIITMFEISKTELEDKLRTKMDKYKYETSSSFDMKLLTTNSNKYPSYYYQTSDDPIKYPLLNSPEEYSHL